MKRTAKLLLFLIFLCSLLTGCNDKNDASPKDQEKVVTILFRGEVSHVEPVLEEFYRRSYDKLHLRLNIETIPPYTYSDELASRLNASEDADLVFDAPWNGMSTQISNKMYMDLEKYFNNDAYPNLKRAFPPEYLDANRFNGKLYGIPLTKRHLDVSGIYYRKDLLEQYKLGFNEITSQEELQKYYDAVLADSRDIYPFASSKRGFFLTHRHSIDLMQNHVYPINGWTDTLFPGYIVLSPDERKVEDVVFLGDDDARFSALNTKYNYDFMKSEFRTLAQWNQYIHPDSMALTNSKELFLSGQAASFESTISSQSDLHDTLKAFIPNAECGFFPADELFNSSDLKPGAIPSNMDAWNYLCIPWYSKHADEAMSFLDWLFSSQENVDLFELGREGYDWIASSDKEYLPLGNPTLKYSIPSYELTWNPNFSRTPASYSPKEKKLLEYTADLRSYRVSPLAGWTLDTKNIAVEVSRLTDLYSRYFTPFYEGLYGDDTDKYIEEFCRLSGEMGLETVRKEIKTQVQNYLDKGF